MTPPSSRGARRLVRDGIMGWMRERDLTRDIGSFVAIGDSFTEGLNDPLPDGGFRGWADRVAAVPAGGGPGFRYGNLAGRGKLLAEVIAEQLPRAVDMAPDLVSVAAGGNDILRGTDVDILAARFDAGVARLQAAGCRVVIFTGFDPRVFPVIRLLRGRIAAYNMHLRGIADDRGADLVDLWSMRVLADPLMWSSDRLHLSSEGHRRVALRSCEILGVPQPEDWRVPLPLAPLAQATGPAAVWVSARRRPPPPRAPGPPAPPPYGCPPAARISAGLKSSPCPGSTAACTAPPAV